MRKTSSLPGQPGPRGGRLRLRVALLVRTFCDPLERLLAAGLVRAAYLRELHGNLTGAFDLMQMAFDSIPTSESEDQSWLLTQMSHLKLISGDPSGAELYANAALTTFPGYHYALNALAQVRIAQARYSEAVKLLRSLYESAPHAENLYALAEAQKLAGQLEDSQRSFEQFAEKSRNESNLTDNSNRELISYYADEAGEPGKALRIAQIEMQRRHDVFTLDAYAWALAANGDYERANQEIQKALSIGVRDPKILSHAHAISIHLEQDNRAAAAPRSGGPHPIEVKGLHVNAVRASKSHQY